MILQASVGNNAKVCLCKEYISDMRHKISHHFPFVWILKLSGLENSGLIAYLYNCKTKMFLLLFYIGKVLTFLKFSGVFPIFMDFYLLISIFFYILYLVLMFVIALKANNCKPKRNKSLGL